MIEGNIDHECTTDIVCPYCGWEDIDSWEMGSGYSGYDHMDGVDNCGSCGKEFQWQRETSVTYTTRTKENQ